MLTLFIAHGHPIDAGCASSQLNSGVLVFVLLSIACVAVWARLVAMWLCCALRGSPSPYVRSPTPRTRISPPESSPAQVRNWVCLCLQLACAVQQWRHSRVGISVQHFCVHLLNCKQCDQLESKITSLVASPRHFCQNGLNQTSKCD